MWTNNLNVVLPKCNKLLSKLSASCVVASIFVSFTTQKGLHIEMCNINYLLYNISKDV
jgi:hypothetical protein